MHKNRVQLYCDTFFKITFKMYHEKRDTQASTYTQIIPIRYSVILKEGRKHSIL